jgi:hypothetical protein
MPTTKIYDIGNSVLMGLDVLGLISELKSKQPVTIGGCAQRRYREYINSFVPVDYEPSLHADLRTKRYFHAQGLEVAAVNIYAAWIATFFSWILLPIVQPLNVYRVIKARRAQRSTHGAQPTMGRAVLRDAGALDD